MIKVDDLLKRINDWERITVSCKKLDKFLRNVILLVLKKVKEIVDGLPRYELQKEREPQQSLNDNQPLKFEEIKTCEPIFDKKDYGWVLVMNIDPYQKSIRIIDVDCKNHWIDFEFNRFYRKEVQDD